MGISDCDIFRLKVPDKSIIRLRWYLFALDEFLAHGITRISSEDISRKVGVKAYLIRHDISQFGEFGRPSIGYDTAYLRSCLGNVLRVNDIQNMIWVGGTALIKDQRRRKRFESHGFRFVAIFDSAKAKIGKIVLGLEVLPIGALFDLSPTLDVHGAVLAVTPQEAQSAADILVAAGIRGILNLTSGIVVVPSGICLRNVDLVAELFALSFQCQQAQ